VNNFIHTCAAVLGISAFVFPNSAPLTAIIFLATIAVVVLTFKNIISTSMLIGASVVIVLSAIQGVTEPAVVVSVLSAIILAEKKLRLALIIIVLQTSLASTLQALLSNYLHHWGLETIAPSLLVCILITASYIEQKWKSLLLLSMGVVATILTSETSTSPSTIFLLASTPAIGLTAITAYATEPSPHKLVQNWLTAVIVLGCAFIWFLSPPRHIEDRYVLMPKTLLETPESVYFANYEQVTQATGYEFKRTDEFSTIPNNAIVLIPTLIVDDNQYSSEKFRQEFIHSANQKKWTVVLIGDHTNISNVAKKINHLIGKEGLRDDLTVPPNNGNTNGPLRSADLRAWPQKAFVNRGGSIQLQSLRDRALLEGDAWWAEESINEWLWVGDYLWNQKERNGRLTLAGAFDYQNIRWIVLGDSSPILNEQILNNTTAFKRIFEIASLWPLFLRDLFLLLIGAVCVLLTTQPYKNGLITSSLLAIALVSISPAVSEKYIKTLRTISINNGENYFKKIANSEPLLTSGWRLIAPKSGLDDINTNSHPTIYVGLIEKSGNFGSLQLDQCFRLGNIRTDEGPTLMDAQGCRIRGNAEILIGTSNAAAAFRTNIENQPVIVILDKKFLTNDAPNSNTQWIEKLIKR
jgi:hypothetical protein